MLSGSKGPQGQLNGWQEGLLEMGTLEQKPVGEKGVSQEDSGGRTFQTEGIASAKALRERYV